MQIHDIIIKHVNGELITGTEAELLQNWRKAASENEKLFQELTNADSLGMELSLMKQFDGIEAWAIFHKKQVARKAKERLKIYRWTAAAAVFACLIAVAGYIWLPKKQAIRPLGASAKIVEPGKEGAILTLADGSQISLDSMNNQVVALQGGVTAKLVNGTLMYAGVGEDIVYNTVTTPRGRQIHIGLPDGTMVWLNAASSIRFPTVFRHGYRKVEVTGEVYFEVTKNEHLPFLVAINNIAEVQVLGTQFNINAYFNESYIRTTLLNGAVKVGWKNSTLLNLIQGQQAIMRNENTNQGANTVEVKKLSSQDLDNVIAWKNGYFDFDNSSLSEILRQLERWYDIEVVYENGVPNVELTGNMTRDISLADLMEGMEKLGVSSRLEGRKLIILRDHQ